MSFPTMLVAHASYCKHCIGTHERVIRLFLCVAKESYTSQTHAVVHRAVDRSSLKNLAKDTSNRDPSHTTTMILHPSSSRWLVLVRAGCHLKIDRVPSGPYSTAQVSCP